jgi:hypothetical protein
MRASLRLVLVTAAVLGLQFLTGLALAADTAEPTPEQLKDAREAFARVGAYYHAEIDAQTKQTRHVFENERSMTDADLAKLPQVPFAFGLSLYNTEVTDAGMKELKKLKQLTSLSLRLSKVTDAGLKELKEMNQLTSLDLFNTRVTDAGIKELKALNNLSSLFLDYT